MGICTCFLFVFLCSNHSCRASCNEWVLLGFCGPILVEWSVTMSKYTSYIVKVQRTRLLPSCNEYNWCYLRQGNMGTSIVGLHNVASFLVDSLVCCQARGWCDHPLLISAAPRSDQVPADAGCASGGVSTFSERCVHSSSPPGALCKNRHQRLRTGGRVYSINGGINC
jgi:hypothetical protein